MKMSFSVILFLIGFGAAIILGLAEGFEIMPTQTWIPWVLVIAGLLIGIMNVSNNEAMPVMVAALLLGAGTGVLSLIPTIGMTLEAVLVKIAFLSVPIAIPAGVKTLVNKIKN